MSLVNQSGSVSKILPHAHHYFLCENFDCVHALTSYHAGSKSSGCQDDSKMVNIVYKSLDFNTEELHIVGNLSIFGTVVALQLPDEFKQKLRGRKAKAKNYICKAC